MERVNPKTILTKCLRLQDNKIFIKTDKVSLNLDLNMFKKVRVIGVGKASAKMALGIEHILGSVIDGGTIVTKQGHTESLQRINVIEASHPIPDSSSVHAANIITSECKKAGEETLIINLVSGGGSALLSSPFQSNEIDSYKYLNLKLCHKQETTRALLASGATIHELNCVRKHLSSLKGGRMAKEIYPATSVNLILSDVVGNQLDTIASGITVPDTTSFNDAAEILHKYSLWESIPPEVRKLIEAGINGIVEDTPKYGHSAFTKTHNILIGTGEMAINAAADAAREMGFLTKIVSVEVTGESREVGKDFFTLAQKTKAENPSLKQPICIIAAGETTVTVNGKGKGGRCQEMALAFLNESIHDSNLSKFISFLPAGTDGNDGPTDAAGAFSDPIAIEQNKISGLDPHQSLMDNDSYTFFSDCNSLFKPGATNTNVADVFILIIR